MKPITTVLLLAVSLMCAAIAFNQFDAYKIRHSRSPGLVAAQPPQAQTAQSQKTRPPEVEALVGKPAPDFNLVAFDGSKTVKLSDYKGRPVIVTFWATYCGWCRDEAPWFSKMQAKYGNEGLQVLSVVPLVDSTREEVEHALKTWGIRYPVLISDQSAETAYDVNWFPTTVYINPQGIVVKAEAENVKGLEKLEENVQAMLR